MSLKQVNNNILREARYSLKIINGENAEVYTNTFANKNLNNYGYWDEFLRTTDSIEIPLIGINNMIKGQSIWYRNKGQYDSCEVEVDADYTNNILEFLNKGVKNFDLDYDSIEQLIFIVKIAYINSIGRQTYENLFVGRPEINTNTDTVLTFTVNQLDFILKDSDFETNVAEYPTASSFNFVNLFQAFANIYNTPHNIEDDYTYPVVPFIVNEESYITETVGDEYLEETEIIPATYQTYAEDYVINYDDGNEGTRNQMFFYRDSPECGIVDLFLDKDGTITSTDVTYLNSFKFFRNSDETFAGADEIINNNIFRCFRPIRTFIAEEQNTSMIGATIGLSSLQKFKATQDFTRIDIGDEIVVLEQLVDIRRGSNNIDILNLIFFEHSSNVFFYNKTKSMMYWNEVAYQVMSTPFPSLWLDLRLTGYFDANIYYNTFYDIYDIGILNFLFTGIPFLARNPDTSIERIEGQNFRIISSADYGDYATWLRFDNILGMTDKDTFLFVEKSTAPDTQMLSKLDALSKFNPKSVRMRDNLSLLWYYKAKIVDNTDSMVFAITFDWLNIVDTTYSYSGASTEGHIFDISNDPTNKTLGMSVELSIAGYGVDGDMFERTLIDYPNLGISQGYQVKGDELYYSMNSNFYDATNYYFKGNTSYKYDGSLISIDKTINDRILDISIENDFVIYLENDYIKMEKHSDGTLIYESTDQSFLDYMLSMDRSGLYFYDTNSKVYKNLQENFKSPVRLLSYSGSRFDGAVGLANSMFKNIYSDNNGLKRIGFEQPNSITVTDSDITKTSLSVKTYNYNKLEYSKYSKSKNVFSGEDNDDAETKEEDDTEYDEALSVNIYSDIDLDLSVNLRRDVNGINWTVYNQFNKVGESGSIVPLNYSSFDIDLTGIYTGITIYINFFDGVLEVDKSFFGKISKRTLESSSIKDELVSTNNKYIWKDDNTLGLKFPFLYSKYSTLFNSEMEGYWFDDDGNIRKLMIVTIKIDELILFKEDSTIFNIGEQRMIIDSQAKYLNGYGFFNGALRPFESNRASFYIEYMSLNFKDKSTTFRLISI